MSYSYDSFGNLVGQSRSAPNANTENYSYDALQRLTTATRILGGAVTYSYSPSGNILSKSDYGSSYGYQANGCGPHAASSISVVAALGAGTLNYNCDANGNVVTGTGGSANALPVSTTFDASNRPRNAVRGGSMTWGYNTLGERDYELTSNPNERYFVGDDFRVVTGAGGVTRHELGPVTVLRNGGVDTVAPVLHDRLGSVINVTNGGVQSIVEYDVYGKPRNGNMSDRTPATLAIPNFLFGFTGHEHADTVQLIHMKGRIFDYNLGRFLSVDPIIGNPLSSQSINPYSYIGNNPLSGTDPTGYTAMSTEERIDGFKTVSSGAAAPTSSSDTDNKGGSNGHARMTPDGAEGSPRDGAETNILGTTNTIKDPSALPKGMTAATCADLPDECESLVKQQQAHGKFQSNIGKGVDIVDKVATTVVTEAVNPVNYIPGVVELRAAKNVERVAEVANDARIASKNLRSADELLAAANAPINESGLSVAARAWEKHAARPGGTFETLSGNVAQKNEAAGKFVQEVLTNPSTARTELSRGGVEYRLPNGQGFRFDADGSMSGFLDPKH